VLLPVYFPSHPPQCVRPLMSPFAYGFNSLIADLRIGQRPDFPAEYPTSAAQLTAYFSPQSIHCRKHPPDLPVAPLNQDTSVHGFAVFSTQPDLRRRSLHPLPSSSPITSPRANVAAPFIRLSADLHQIRFGTCDPAHQLLPLGPHHWSISSKPSLA